MFWIVGIEPHQYIKLSLSLCASEGEKRCAVVTANPMNEHGLLKCKNTLIAKT